MRRMTNKAIMFNTNNPKAMIRATGGPSGVVD
jgi:hypothetical protein